jgi:hypothetical protein
VVARNCAEGISKAQGWESTFPFDDPWLALAIKPTCLTDYSIEHSAIMLKVKPVESEIAQFREVPGAIIACILPHSSPLATQRG